MTKRLCLFLLLAFLSTNAACGHDHEDGDHNHGDEANNGHDHDDHNNDHDHDDHDHGNNDTSPASAAQMACEAFESGEAAALEAAASADTLGEGQMLSAGAAYKITIPAGGSGFVAFNNPAEHNDLTFFADTAAIAAVSKDGGALAVPTAVSTASCDESIKGQYNMHIPAEGMMTLELSGAGEVWLMIHSAQGGDHDHDHDHNNDAGPDHALMACMAIEAGTVMEATATASAAELGEGNMLTPGMAYAVTFPAEGNGFVAFHSPVEHNDIMVFTDEGERLVSITQNMQALESGAEMPNGDCPDAIAGASAHHVHAEGMVAIELAPPTEGPLWIMIMSAGGSDHSDGHDHDGEEDGDHDGHEHDGE